MEHGTQGRSWTSRIVRRLGRNNNGNSNHNSDHRQARVGVNPRDQQQRTSRKKLSKPPSRVQRSHDSDVNELGEREYAVFSGDSAALVDHTELIHGLALRDSTESLVGGDLAHRLLNDDDPRVVALRARRQAQLATIPRGIWEIIASYLSPADRAQLALAHRILLRNLGDDAFAALNLSENQNERLRFLGHLDRHLPDHLLCFVCARYHRRTQPGLEKLPTPTSPTDNPVVACPAATKTVAPRTRLTHTRALPYAFVQLPLRAYHYGPAHGIPVDRLAREWRESGGRDGAQPRWRHNTRYVCTATGHLLLRVRSHAFAAPGLPPTGMRHLLYEREQYKPYFSACAHWADGELMRVCKCALSHVPETRATGVAEQLRKGPHALAHDLVRPTPSSSSSRECVFCRPARRCPRCPSEYLVKIAMVEDRADPRQLFKAAITVTRYVDLGNGSGPGLSPEWDAVNGAFDGYDSLGLAGKRFIMGTFESIANGSVPGIARMVNMNPEMRVGARDGD